MGQLTSGDGWGETREDKYADSGICYECPKKDIEISKLKKQLKDIKYLDAKEVEKILKGVFGSRYQIERKTSGDILCAKNKILSLAIPDGVVVAEGEIEELTHSQIYKTYTARIKNITHYDFVDDDEGLFKLILIKK